MTAPWVRDRAYDVKRWWTRGGGSELNARWHLRRARSVGRHPRVAGRPLVTTRDLTIGDDLLLWSHYRRTHLGGDGTLVIGDRVFLNAGVVILAFERIDVGDDVALGPEVLVLDSDNHAVGDRPVRQRPVVIGDGSWVASRATILPGVRIGARSVVAAGAVVTDDVPEGAVVAGVPARQVGVATTPDGWSAVWRPPQEPRG